jgi:hypothetical protein
MSTPSTPTPRAPAGLARRGRALWRSVVASYELAEGETALLIETCRVLDSVEALQQTLADAPMMTTGSRGQQTANPLRAELRSERLLLAKLIAQLSLPDVDGEGGKWDGLSASSRARKAARVRWDNRGGSK